MALNGGYAPFSGTSIFDLHISKHGRTLEVLLGRDHADFAGLQAPQLCGCCMSWMDVSVRYPVKVGTPCVWGNLVVTSVNTLFFFEIPSGNQTLHLEKIL